MSFASDNWAGASDKVAAALAEANAGDAPAYGNDPFTARANAALSDYFEREVAAFFVATGSAANALALAHAYRTGGAVIAHPDSHIASDEAGGPLLHAPGMMLDLVDGPAGRLPAEAVAARIARYRGGSPREGRVTALSFANTNELGQTYSPDEVAALAGAAKAHGVRVHLDGARFSNALAFTGAAPADLTWRAGVDMMSLGFTKTGAWCAEAVVFFDPSEGEEFAYRHQQAGHVLSKARFVGAQVCAMVGDGHARELAAHANAMAAALAGALEQSGKAALAVPCQSNEVFAFLAPDAAERLKAAGVQAYPWALRSAHPPAPPEPDWVLHRFVASFRTTPADVERAADALTGSDAQPG